MAIYIVFIMIGYGSAYADDKDICNCSPAKRLSDIYGEYEIKMTRRECKDKKWYCHDEPEKSKVVDKTRCDCVDFLNSSNTARMTDYPRKDCVVDWKRSNYYYCSGESTSFADTPVCCEETYRSKQTFPKGVYGLEVESSIDSGAVTYYYKSTMRQCIANKHSFSTDFLHCDEHMTNVCCPYWTSSRNGGVDYSNTRYVLLPLSQCNMLNGPHQASMSFRLRDFDKYRMRCK